MMILRRFLGLSGILLLAINLSGLLIPLRTPEIDALFADFARPTTLPYSSALSALDNLSKSDLSRSEFIEEATRIFHFGIAHIDPEEIEKKGLEHYRMRVPIWENYLLNLLSYLKPDTYRDYEFCSYRKALERGTGRCGQQSLALVDYLSRNSVETGFIGLGGHAIATAKNENGIWYMLDPDFGGVIPFPLSEAEHDPKSVVPYYWNSAITDRNMYELFDAKDNVIRYGGPEARYRRACPIEQIAYIAKWVIPIIALLIWLILAVHPKSIIAESLK